MGYVDFILNLAGLLLWLNWRSVRFDPLAKRTPATLMGTLRPAAPKKIRRWHLLAVIAGLLPAPQPVAARYVRGAVGYRADLLTLAIPGTRSLARLAVDGLDLAQWMQVGATVRAFHDAGVRHADLNAHNVLIDERSRVHLIDFDRGVRVPPGRWCQHNLARLRRSLVKLRVLPPSGATPEWNALLAGYEAPLSAPPR